MKLVHLSDTHIGRGDNLTRFDRSFADLEETLAGMKDAGARLAPAIDDARDAIGSIKDAAEGAKATLANAGEKLDQIGPALGEVPAAVRSLSKVADKEASHDAKIAALAQCEEIERLCVDKIDRLASSMVLYA